MRSGIQECGFRTSLPRFESWYYPFPATAWTWTSETPLCKKSTSFISGYEDLWIKLHKTHTLKKITEKESKKSWKGEVDMPTTKTDCGSFSKNLVAYQGKTWSTVSFIILIWWKATQQFFKTGRFSSDAWGCAQLCLALCNPVDYSLSGSSVHGLFQVRILEWAAFFFSRGSS